MLVIPAIDLKDGQCVRLKQGRMDEATSYGDDPVANWLRANLGSLIDANRMVLAVGTREFSHLSREIYGSAHTRFRGGSERNIDLATHLIDRLKVHGWDEAQDPAGPTLTADALADGEPAALVQRLIR